jgi:hypothetical protein
MGPAKREKIIRRSLSVSKKSAHGTINTVGFFCPLRDQNTTEEGSMSQRQTTGEIRRKKRSFIITPYHADPQRIMRAIMPQVGPCRVLNDSKCCIRFDHFRRRKTGPPFSLSVFCCMTHNRYRFTAYPPGYLPYVRRRISPVAADGSLVQSMEKSRRRWSNQNLSATVFEAAVDASNGKNWRRDPQELVSGTVSDSTEGVSSGEKGQGVKWWSLQVRWLSWLSMLMGVADDMHESVRWQLACLLDVSLVTLRDAAQTIANNPGYRQRGKMVLWVHQQMRRGPDYLFRLLAAGHAAGLWGQPFYWSPKRHQLYVVPFRPTGKGRAVGAKTPLASKEGVHEKGT